MKLFAQQDGDEEIDYFYRIPQGEITPELKEKIYNAFGLNHLDVNGDRRITFEEAIDQFPKEWRSPEMDEILK